MSVCYMQVFIFRLFTSGTCASCGGHIISVHHRHVKHENRKKFKKREFTIYVIVYTAFEDFVMSHTL